MFKVIYFFAVIGGLVLNWSSVSAQTLGFSGGQGHLIATVQNNSAQAYFALTPTESSQGCFVLIHIKAGSDSIDAYEVLSKTNDFIKKAIGEGLQATKGQWVKEKIDRNVFVPLFYCAEDKTRPERREDIQIKNDFSDWPQLSNAWILKPIVIWVRTPGAVK